MKLAPPTLDQCELVRQWRNAPDVLPMLRTREPLTIEQQEAFYRDVVCNPVSKHRYYALIDEEQFIGLGGLTYIDRLRGEGEISLILGPDFRRGGRGRRAVQALRAEAARLGLTWVVGECYDVNPAQMFWVEIVASMDGTARYEHDRMRFRFRSLLPGQCIPEDAC